MRLRDIAAGPGSTERSAYGIVTDLTAAGYVAKQKDGRRNRYQIQAHVVSGESGCESGEEDVEASGTLHRAACGPAGWRPQITGLHRHRRGWHAVRQPVRVLR